MDFYRDFHYSFPKKKSIPAQAIDTLWFNFCTTLQMNFKTEHLSWNFRQSQQAHMTSSKYDIRGYCVNREISLPFYRGISEQHIPINAQIQSSKTDRLKAIECIYGRQKLSRMRIIKLISKKFQKTNKKNITNFHSNLQCMRSSNSDKKLTSTSRVMAMVSYLMKFKYSNAQKNCLNKFR